MNDRTVYPLIVIHLILLYYHTVKNFGGKKVWRIRTVGSLTEK